MITLDCIIIDTARRLPCRYRRSHAHRSQSIIERASPTVNRYSPSGLMEQLSSSSSRDYGVSACVGAPQETSDLSEASQRPRRPNDTGE